MTDAGLWRLRETPSSTGWIDWDRRLDESTADGTAIVSRMSPYSVLVRSKHDLGDRTRFGWNATKHTSPYDHAAVVECLRPNATCTVRLCRMGRETSLRRRLRTSDWARSDAHVPHLYDLSKANTSVAAMELISELEEGVEWIEVVKPVTTRTQWAQIWSGGAPRREDPPPRWEGAGEIVTVIDAGLDAQHSFFLDTHHDVPYYRFEEGCPALNLRNSMHRKIVGYVRVPNSRVEESERQDRPSLHGTHVVGSIVGDPMSTNREFRGLSPNARVLFFDIGGENVDAHSTMHVPEDVTGILETSYMSGSRIGSISWGMDDNQYPELCRQIDEFLWNHDDYVIVVAAGNEGRNGNNTVGSPATCKNVFAVGASGNAYAALEWTRQHPSTWGTSTPPNSTESSWEKYLDGPSPFSSRGWTSDKRAKPDCLAPGGPVISAKAHSHDQLLAKYGTSQAAPLVAAVAANWREWASHQEPGKLVSAALIRGLLVATATPTATSVAAPNREAGFGRCNLRGPDALTNPHQLWILDDITIHPLKELQWCVRLTEWRGAAKIVLSWTDPPSSTATPSSANHLLNDLDLRVDSNDWIEYGNDHFDNRNNLERVIVSPSNQTSILRIRVRTRHLVDSFARFALVAHADAGQIKKLATCPRNVHPTTHECVPNADSLAIGIQGSELPQTCQRRQCLPNAYFHDGHCHYDHSEEGVQCPKEWGVGLLVNGVCRPSQCADTFYMDERGRCRCTRPQRCTRDAHSGLRPCIDGHLGGCESRRTGTRPSYSFWIWTLPWFGILFLVILRKQRITNKHTETKRRSTPRHNTFFEPLKSPWVHTDTP